MAKKQEEPKPDRKDSVEKKPNYNITDHIISVPSKMVTGADEESSSKISDMFVNNKKILIGIVIFILICIVFYMYKDKLSNFDGNKVTKSMRSDSQSASWNLKERVDNLMKKQNTFFKI